MKILDVKQNTPEWLAARAGIVTASDLDSIVTPTWKPRTGEGVETYLCRKLAERCMGAPLEQLGSWAADQGSSAESEAFNWFRWETKMDVQRVGFITDDAGTCGCSPDGIIGDDGGLELKFPQPEQHIKYLLAGVVPPAYLPQVHGSLYVSGRPWWVFCSYSRQFPALVVKVERDEAIIAAIDVAVKAFNARLDAAYAKMKALAIGEDERPLPPGRQFRPLVFAA